MDIQGYILDRWKLKMTDQTRSLVIYDPEGRYQEILQRATADGIEVIDTSEAPLNARLRAAKYWSETLATNPDARLIIYRRRPMPCSNVEWVREPYAAFAQSAQLFPVPPRDDYKNLCEQFMPAKIQELNNLFDAGNTSFNFINSLLEGNSYPALENLTRGRSIVEITTRLLNLESCDDMNWLGEWRTLTTAHYPGLDTNAATLEQVQSKLWTYLLFSEFVLDLPEALPESLSSVARAPIQCQEHIYLICDTLRGNHNMRDKYVHAANEVATALNLPTLFARSAHLGERVTFQFENNVEFTRFINHIKNGELTQAHQMLEKNRNDVWYQEDQGIATFWRLAEQLLALIDCMGGGIKTDGTLSDLVEWYARQGYLADKAFRTFNTIKLLQNEAPYENELTDLLMSRYRDFADRSVKVYQDKIREITSTSTLANQVCKQRVYSALSEGKRVAAVFVDAMRYEIGSTFCESLNRIYPEQVTCEPRLSVLPAVTRFGMANHLDDITMAVVDGELQPTIGGKPIITVPDRMAHLKERTGTEMQHFRIDEFAKEKVNDNTRLLVLLSTTIDSTCEQPTVGVRGITSIQPELKLLASAVDACRTLGFDEIHFAADHGFMLQPKPLVSDKIDKPAGSNICLEESRCLVGNLNETVDTLSFTPQELGIDGDFMRISFAKGFTVFRKNEKYFHEGLSLQENVVPIVSVKFKEEKPKETFSVQLKYKGEDTGTVRTYSPLLTVNIFGSIFGDDINFKLAVQDRTGRKIGVPAESQFYDDATETIHVPAGTTSFRQRIDIDEEFNDNEFVILALDCNTNALLAKIVLKFDSLT